MWQRQRCRIAGSEADKSNLERKKYRRENMDKAEERHVGAWQPYILGTTRMSLHTRKAATRGHAAGAVWLVLCQLQL